MSLDMLKHEVESLPVAARRKLMAFMVALEDQSRAGYAAPVLSAPRPIGLAQGQFTVPDDFNDPLPEDVLRTFEGK